MESTLPNQSSDASDVKQAFRKPTNDASGRRYRRRTPLSDADSSSSDEYSKHGHGHGHGQMPSREDRAKYDPRRRNEQGSDREHYHRHGRNTSRYMDSDREDRYKYMSSHGHHGKERRDVDGEDRNNRKSHSGWESRDTAPLDHARQEQSRGHRRYPDRYSRDKFDDGFRSHSTKSIAGDHPKDRGTRDERRDPRSSPGRYKNDDRYLCEGSKNYSRDLNVAKDKSSKSTSRSGNKESDEQDNILNKRKHDKKRDWDINKYDRESDDVICKKKDSSSQLDKNDRHDGQKNLHADDDPCTSTKKHKLGHLENTFDSVGIEKSASKLKGVAEDERLDASGKQVKEINSKFTSAPISSVSEAEPGVDVNAAKVAALKAAELVNRNIGGVGFLSTDQKKKLLWGSKKSTASEESGSRWEVPMFSDRERQEKFNKLMSLRLPWCLWPIVGCKGRVEASAQSGGQGWEPSSRETRATPDGFGKTIHSRASKKRWPNCWARLVRTTILSFCYPNTQTSNKHFMYCFWLGDCIAFIYRKSSNSDKKDAEIWTTVAIWV